MGKTETGKLKPNFQFQFPWTSEKLIHGCIQVNTYSINNKNRFWYDYYLLKMSSSINKNQPMRLDCPNLKVPIRSEPTSKGAITGYLQSGTVIEVKMKESKGFYELADGSVSYCY